MRRNFAQVLREGKIDLNREYSKLYNLFYGKDDDGESDADVVSQNLQSVHFCGTCLDLNEFDEVYGFNFVSDPQKFDVDYFLSFCEYIYNFAAQLNFPSLNNFSFYLNHIHKLVDKIGYMFSSQDGITIIVPKDSAAIAVSESEQVNKETSYKLISYNHYSMRGNLQEKKNTILLLADLLEPRREELTKADKTLCSDLFYMFNNLNIRHNNIDPVGNKYKKVVAEMPKEELEHWYDETYQMCLLAFLQLDHAERKVNFNELKNRIEKNNIK